MFNLKQLFTAGGGTPAPEANVSTSPLNTTFSPPSESAARSPREPGAAECLSCSEGADIQRAMLFATIRSWRRKH
jgi:hypothetical protein